MKKFLMIVLLSSVVQSTTIISKVNFWKHIEDTYTIVWDDHALAVSRLTVDFAYILGEHEVVEEIDEASWDEQFPAIPYALDESYDLVEHYFYKITHSNGVDYQGYANYQKENVSVGIQLYPIDSTIANYVMQHKANSIEAKEYTIFMSQEEDGTLRANFIFDEMLYNIESSGLSIRDFYEMINHIHQNIANVDT